MGSHGASGRGGALGAGSHGAGTARPRGDTGGRGLERDEDRPGVTGGEPEGAGASSGSPCSKSARRSQEKGWGEMREKTDGGGGLGATGLRYSVLRVRAQPGRVVKLDFSFSTRPG
jgi:hypothetical protein